MTPTRPPTISASLARLLDTSADATFTLDAEGRFTYANRSAAAIVCRTPEELLGRSLERDFGHAFSERWLSESRRARAEGRDVEYDAFNPVLGGWVRVRFVPLGDELAVQLRDVTALGRTAALQRVTVALSEADTPEAVVQVLLDHTVAASEAYMGAIVRPDADGTHLRLEGEVGYTPELRARFARFPRTLDIPPCAAANTGQPVFVGGPDFDRRYPGSVGVRADSTRSIAALPLVVEGQLWGVLALSYREDRRFDAAEREFLETLVRQCAQALERATARARLVQQAETLEVLNRIGQTLSGELELDRLVQAVTDATTELTGAQFGALFYNVVDANAEKYTLYTLSGVPREAFASFPMPRNTKVFGPTFAGEGVVRVADITRDPRYGQNPPYHGMPEGHLPVRSYLAVPVVSRSGEVIGGLFFGHSDPDVFTERAEQLAVGLAAQTAIALDNARLYQQINESHALLEARVAERTRELEEERVALDAFAAFSELTATTSDVHALARRAARVLQATLGEVSVAYYELDGGLWKAQMISEDVPPDAAVAARAGFPLEMPSFARAVEARDVLFVDGWDGVREGASGTEVYGAAAFRPYFVRNEPYGMFTMGSAVETTWPPRARAVFRAVTRSLGLALERAEQTWRLEEQNVELEMRTRALEAFADLTRDLTVTADPLALVRRAQEIMLSLLPDGYALYWQLDDGIWRNRSRVGSLGNEALQAAVEAGLPHGRAPTLDTPWTTRQPLYEDVYSRGADTDPGVVQHVNAVAMLPVVVGGEAQGLIGVGLFDRRHWTPADRAVLETVTRSLSLALEGAGSARALRERTRELLRSNAELERFAYVASHDLQEPLRTIASFTELLNRRYGDALDDSGRKYLSLVTRGAERMKVLIDDLLVFSRLNAVQEAPRPVAAAEVLSEALTRLQGAITESGARVTSGALPTVSGVPSELVQLFQNLVGNALKFRRDGVTPEVSVTATREGPSWHFEVRDNGLGFEQKYAERIFQIFQRLHVREKYEGTGMGLAIVRKIVEHHGGQVWAESVPGEGSTFHFTLRDASPAGEDA